LLAATESLATVLVRTFPYSGFTHCWTPASSLGSKNTDVAAALEDPKRERFTAQVGIPDEHQVALETLGRGGQRLTGPQRRRVFREGGVAVAIRLGEGSYRRQRVPDGATLPGLGRLGGGPGYGGDHHQHQVSLFQDPAKDRLFCLICRRFGPGRQF